VACGGPKTDVDDRDQFIVDEEIPGVVLCDYFDLVILSTFGPQNVNIPNFPKDWINLITVFEIPPVVRGDKCSDIFILGSITDDKPVIPFSFFRPVWIIKIRLNDEVF
jgi:hypothetical protein